MITAKQKLFLVFTGFIFVIGMVFVALVVTPQKAAAQTIDCPVDPDYSAAGSFKVPIGNREECQRDPQYIFSGDTTKPSITYSRRSSTGTITTLATLALQDPAANPLIWRGAASYDGHTIQIAIPREGLVAGSTGTDAIRTDYPKDGSAPVNSGVKIAVNDTIREFANKQEIAIQSGTANLQADCKTKDGEALDKSNCGIVGYIVGFTKLLSALVGIVIVIMIAVGGVQYTTARDDPNAVSAAKTRIRNAILSLVFYIFSVAFLNYLIPGGLF